MRELPKFETFAEDIPSRLHPIARAKAIGAKAIELEGGLYHSLPFADDAKDSGIWLPKSHVYTIGRLRRLHQRVKTDQLFASAEQSVRELERSSASLTNSLERFANSSEQLLDTLDNVREDNRNSNQEEKNNGEDF